MKIKKNMIMVFSQNYNDIVLATRRSVFLT